MKHFIFLTLFISNIFYCSCSDNNIEYLKNYTPAKKKIDSTIFELNLEMNQKIKLHENEDNIVLGCVSLVINENGNEIAVVDDGNQSIFIYNAINGELNYRIEADTSLDNIPYYSGTQPYDFEFRGVKMEGFKYIHSNEYMKYEIPDFMINVSNNDYFSDCFFQKDTLVTLLQGYALSRKFENGKPINHNSCPNMPIVLYYHKGELIKSIVIETTAETHPGAVNFVYDDYSKIFYISTPDLKDIHDEIINDSLSVLNSFDINGKPIEEVAFLDREYIAKYSCYDIPWEPVFKLINRDLYTALPHSLYIKKNNDILFKFHNLPYSNDSSFVYLPKLHDYVVNSKENFEGIYTFLYQYFPVRLMDFFELQNGNLGFAFLIIEEKQKKHYIIFQEYTKNGKLLKQKEFPSNEVEFVSNLTYHKQSNQLILLLKNKRGWFLEKRTWE